MGIQRCLRALVEMDGSEKRTMNLHHSRSPFLSRPCTPTVPSCSPFVLRLCLCISDLALARPLNPSSAYVFHPSIHPPCPSDHSLDTWKEAEKVIYSSFQDTASSSIYSTPTLFWSLHRYETGAWVVISSSCGRLVRSEMTCTVPTYTTTTCKYTTKTPQETTRCVTLLTPTVLDTKKQSL